MVSNLQTFTRLGTSRKQYREYRFFPSLLFYSSLYRIQDTREEEDTGHRIHNTGDRVHRTGLETGPVREYRIQDIGFRILQDIGCSLQNTQYWIRDT